jgi:hypothetical protein
MWERLPRVHAASVRAAENWERQAPVLQVRHTALPKNATMQQALDARLMELLRSICAMRQGIAASAAHRWMVKSLIARNRRERMQISIPGRRLQSMTSVPSRRFLHRPKTSFVLGNYARKSGRNI